MKADLPRVIYLSSTEIGQDLLNWFKTLPCQVILAETGNRKISEFPSYDLGISFLYTHQIPTSEFHTPYKWVNFHPGPLPEFRGRNLAYHAIMEDSPHFGATIHYMDCEFDTGEIIEVSRFPVLPCYTAGDLVSISHAKLVELFKKYLPKLLVGKVASRPQGENGRYYRRTPIKDEIELTEEQLRRIRAITVMPHYFPRVNVGGTWYRLVPDEQD